MKLKRRKKYFLSNKGQEVEVIVWWGIALVIAVIFGAIMFYNKGAMGGAIDKIKSLFSFGRS